MCSERHVVHSDKSCGEIKKGCLFNWERRAPHHEKLNMLILTIKAPRLQGQAARRETVSGKLHIGRLLRGEGRGCLLWGADLVAV